MWHQKDKFSRSESFLGWLMGDGNEGGCGADDPSTESMTQESRVIAARLRIIRTLKQRGVPEGAPLLRRVARAPALEDLWYLRPEIMQALSSMHGETHAHSIMTSHIAPLFAGSLSSQVRTQHGTRGALHAHR
jgi:hypothetical protein